ncbi:hypothetical protein GCM10028895_20640 [Pontibacter rugosus]
MIELDLPGHEPRLVVNSVINPDSAFVVDVSASQSAFSAGAHQPITNAMVQVYQAGQLVSSLQSIGNGKYTSDQKPQPLQHYTMQVSAAGFTTVDAATFVPASPIIRDLRAARVAPAADMYEETTAASFILADNPEQDNFYYIQAYTPDTTYEGKAYRRSVNMEFTAPFEEEFTMEDRYFFSDKLFNGKSVPLELHLQNLPANTTYVRVAHITPEYYHYVRTLEKQSYKDNFSTTPESVANNIKNGIGIFAGYHVVTLAVKVK